VIARRNFASSLLNDLIARRLISPTCRTVYILQLVVDYPNYFIYALVSSFYAVFAVLSSLASQF
jgi:hypothetical protein